MKPALATIACTTRGSSKGLINYICFINILNYINYNNCRLFEIPPNKIDALMIHLNSNKKTVHQTATVYEIKFYKP